MSRWKDSRTVYPGGWVKASYAHKDWGDLAMERCIQCGRASCGPVWIHIETKVVRCLKDEPPEITEWADTVGSSVRGPWGTSKRAEKREEVSDQTE